MYYYFIYRRLLEFVIHIYEIGGIRKQLDYIMYFVSLKNDSDRGSVWSNTNLFKTSTIPNLLYRLYNNDVGFHGFSKAFRRTNKKKYLL